MQEECVFLTMTTDIRRVKLNIMAHGSRFFDRCRHLTDFLVSRSRKNRSWNWLASLLGPNFPPWGLGCHHRAQPPPQVFRSKREERPGPIPNYKAHEVESDAKNWPKKNNPVGCTNISKYHQISIYLSIYPSIYLSSQPSIHPSIYLINLSIYLSIYLSI